MKETKLEERIIEITKEGPRDYESSAGFKSHRSVTYKYKRNFYVDGGTSDHFDFPWYREQTFYAQKVSGGYALWHHSDIADESFEPIVFAITTDLEQADKILHERALIFAEFAAKVMKGKIKDKSVIEDSF